MREAVGPKDERDEAGGWRADAGRGAAVRRPGGREVASILSRIEDRRSTSWFPL